MAIFAVNIVHLVRERHTDIEKRYLQYVPSQEKQIILGCHWLSVEWNPSNELVCASGESFFTLFNKDFFVMMPCNLSWALVPTKDIPNVIVLL